MATQKIAYAAAASITVTLASLATASARRAAAVTNSTNLYVDGLVLLAILVGTGTSGTSIVQMGIAASADDGTTYETGGSTDAAYTVRGDERWIRNIQTPTASTTYAGVGTIAQWFGGSMPRDWALLVNNLSASTLSATEGNHTKKFQGVTFTVA